ncbi:ribosomal biogenesis protein LAS1L-like [Ylistrum balloti]|uniref:ribosomal biogenesis protein LAS1L-like n=1 Tax=Ylistrum balloti TaxID=509963 RepID=UPI002905C1D4|nr:ribosomal biogenesis protein LAS1L-like [Ylistrum balloti]
MNQVTRRRVVPWKNRKEFECVYNEVFGNDPRQQTHAVGRIDVWRSRALHKIPVAIDSTAAIVHAKLHHQKAVQLKQDRQQDNEIRSSYSLAVIRFVNHITEKGQTGEYALPIHVIASQVGVPEWIVHLRHDATHRHLPPLPMLTSACDWALSWLKAEFWEKQLNSMASNVDGKRTDSSDILDIRVILERYQQHKLQEIDEKSFKDYSSKIVKNFETVPVQNRHQLVTCLVEEGFIIPTQEQLQALRIDPSKLEKPDCALPHMLILFWKPVLQFLHQLNLTNSLLIKLASKVSTKFSMQDYVMCGWIHHIITSNEQANTKNANRNSTRLYKRSVPLKFRPVLESLLYIPCDYTIPLIKRLLNLGKEKEYTENQITQIGTLMDQLQPSVPKRQPEADKVEQNSQAGQADTNKLGQKRTFTLADQDKIVYNVEDLRSRKKRCERSDDNVNAVKDSSSAACAQPLWQLCEDHVDWSQVPIGILPGQTLDYMTLDMSTNNGDGYPPDLPTNMEETFSHDLSNMEETFSHDLSTNDEGDFYDLEELSCEEEIDNEIKLLEETCHHDSVTVSSAAWSLEQLSEIKQGVRLL